MERKYRIMIAGLGAVAVLGAAVATTAFAATRSGAPEIAVDLSAAPTDLEPATAAVDYQAWGCPIAAQNYEAVAKLLGMTSQEIEAQLKQGKSLAEIAAAKGVNEDRLVATILAPMKEFMQAQVTSGRWTQGQLDAMLKQAEQHVRQLVKAKGTTADNWGCGGQGMMGGWGSNTPGTARSDGSFFGRGGMMGGGYGGMMGSGGMMGGATRAGGMMGRWR